MTSGVLGDIFAGMATILSEQTSSLDLETTITGLYEQNLDYGNAPEMALELAYDRLDYNQRQLQWYVENRPDVHGNMQIYDQGSTMWAAAITAANEKSEWDLMKKAITEESMGRAFNTNMKIAKAFAHLAASLPNPVAE